MLMINVIIVTTQAMPTLHSSFGRQGALISLLAEARVPMFLFIWIPFGDHPLKLERYRED
jgi:hypothetical protein